MPERPLLIFPVPAGLPKARKFGGSPDLVRPSPARQRERLEPAFAELERIRDARQVELLQDPAGAEPEQVLVFETVGTVAEFIRAVQRIEGLEWLGDIDVDDIPADEEFHKKGGVPGEPLGGCLYLVLSNQRGLQELLSLWGIFQRDPEHARFQRGFAKWGHLFRQLRAVRPWGSEDRWRETGLLEEWRERVRLGEETVRVEIELWFRPNAVNRATAERAVRRAIADEGGSVLTEYALEAIRYHALLVSLPIQAVDEILQLRQTRLAKSDPVMLFRPAAQIVFPLPEEEPLEKAAPVGEAPAAAGNAVVALFDGLPLENHRLLAGRLVVDDPDGWAATTPARTRMHGTAMASLLVHGDLEAREPALIRPIYTRPILKPETGFASSWESIPDELLAVDLFHRAVRRLFEPEGDDPPAAPSVRIVSLSVGDRVRLYDRYPSPWARLLDHLACQYGLLFLVSAGNHSCAVTLSVTNDEWPATDSYRIQGDVIRAAGKEARLRRLCSPAEAVNAITVGAVHNDRSTISVELTAGRYLINPLPDPGLPSPINAQGPGFQRSVKPDLLFPGGRIAFQRSYEPGPHVVLEPVTTSIRPPALLVAAPAPEPGRLDAVCYVRGTSGATALAARTAARLYDLLQELRAEPGGDRLGDEHAAVLVKALLVHGARWGDGARVLAQALPPNSRDTLPRLLGYGAVAPERLFECTEQRATLLGWGSLADGEAHRYVVPLPGSLNGQRVWRCLTATLAWLSPINPAHRLYRKADLWFDLHGDWETIAQHDTAPMLEIFEEAVPPPTVRRRQGKAADLLRVENREVKAKTSQRGTLQHQTLHDEQAALFPEDGTATIQVNCRAAAGEMTETVAYGLAVTLEVAPETRLPIYEEIRARIRPRVEVGVEPPTG
jgi:hypothetical protein